MRHLFRLAILCGAVFAIPGCNGCDDDGDDDPPLPPPAAPSGLAATAITTERIDLSWADNATDETDYRVERSPDGTTWTQIAILPAGSTSAVVRGLTPNTPYFFRVAAANSTTLSAYAGPATAGTFARTWTGPISPATRPDLTKHTAVYDAANQRMIVFGGVDISGFTNNVWALSLATVGAESWGTGALAPGGTAPSPRWQHSAIYDSANQRMIVCGGEDGTSRLADVHSLDLTAGSESWSPLTIAAGPAPAARRNHTAIYDAANGRMILFGGNTAAGTVNDVWSLTLPTSGSAVWSQLSPALPPSNREGHSAVYDVPTQSMTVFGGNDGIIYNGEVWTLSLPGSGSGTWTLVSPTVMPPETTPPSARQGHAAIFDAGNGRMTFYSGDDFTAPPTTTDTWALNPTGGTSWQRLSTGGPSTGRYGHTAVYDSVNQRMVIFGGWDDNFVPFDDVWTLRL